MDRWKMYLSGLGTTLLITVIAITLGTALGIIACLCKISNIKILKGIASAYIYIIRGTPTVLQLFIIYFGVLANWDSAVLIASIAFGINSGAYVAEIIRSGIMAVDRGQTEAGRSLGLNDRQTMTHIVFPQAIKNCIPTYISEFVVLIKETAVAGACLPVYELMKQSNEIYSKTYEIWIPYLMAGLLYLIVTGTLTFLLGRVERRLRVSDTR